MARSLSVLALALALAAASAAAPVPVSPNASPEAVALLDYLHEVSGTHTLAGQHCAPQLGSTRLSVVHRRTQRYPAVFGQDFGFSYPGYWDGINYRQRIVDEAILRHRDGFVITIMWHAVPPTMDEPVEFADGIQSDLTEAEWEALVTPGTDLNERWQSQVDVIAFFLKQLRDADVPVLWRPYHEMNGGWFWWGQKPGDDGYKRLWRMLFDRLTAFHGLNNLIWVYNTNEVKEGVDAHAAYYPGDDVVDVLATDVYTEGFNTMNYETLLDLAGEKPIALGEVGAPPSLEVLDAQPRWAWFMQWGEPGPGGGGPEGFRSFLSTYASGRVLTLEELPWVDTEAVRHHYPIVR